MSTWTSGEVARRAFALIDMGRPEEAISILQPALSEEPDSYRLLCLMGLASIRAKRLEDAEQATSRAMVVNPEGEWAYRLANIAFSEAGRNEEAFRAAEEALRRGPNLWQSHIRMADTASRLGRHELAFKYATHSLSIAPLEPEAHFITGVVYLRAGHRAEAKAAFERTLSLRPGHSGALNNLAGLQMKHGSLREAARGFSAALAADPRSSRASYNIDLLVGKLLSGCHVLVFSSYLAAALLHSVRWVNYLFIAIALFATPGALLYVQRLLPRSMRVYLRSVISRDKLIGASVIIDLLVLLDLVLVPLRHSLGDTSRALYDVAALILFILGTVVLKVLSARLRKRARALPGGSFLIPSRLQTTGSHHPEANSAGF